MADAVTEGVDARRVVVVPDLEAVRDDLGGWGRHGDGEAELEAVGEDGGAAEDSLLEAGDHVLGEGCDWAGVVHAVVAPRRLGHGWVGPGDREVVGGWDLCHGCASHLREGEIVAIGGVTLEVALTVVR